jgi:Cellulase (glycosyl hydrolase family 5)
MRCIAASCTLRPVRMVVRRAERDHDVVTVMPTSPSGGRDPQHTFPWQQRGLVRSARLLQRRGRHRRSADEVSWVPTWDATHNQTSLDYRGSETSLEANLKLIYNRTQLLEIPLVVGEWGAQTADVGAATYDAQMLDLLSRYRLSWARWTLGAATFTYSWRRCDSAGGELPGDLRGLDPKPTR